MKRELNTAIISFSDGSTVQWRYIGKCQRLYSIEKKYAIQVRVEDGANSIDQFFETWDKPSVHTAQHFIKNAIKDAKQSPIK